MKLTKSHAVGGSLWLACLSATAAVPLPALNVDTTRGQRHAVQPQRLLGHRRFLRLQLRAEERRAAVGHQGDGDAALIRQLLAPERKKGRPALPATPPLQDQFTQLNEAAAFTSPLPLYCGHIG